MDKNGFFIGWQEDLPRSNRSAIRKLLLGFLVIGIAVVFLFVFNQSKFNNHFFRFGEITEVIGVYHNEPFPILTVAGPDFKEEVSRDLLLVGYGKSGAEGIMELIQSKAGSLDGKTIKVQGSLIHGDGRSILELTKKSESFIEIVSQEEVESLKDTQKSEITLTGEIVDPKCYFGVMKPGEGKIHKSCAIRCISGGIPPVLKVEKGGENEYYIIIGEDGSKVNKEVLEFIAEPVRVTGNAYQKNGWNIFEINPADLVLL